MLSPSLSPIFGTLFKDNVKEVESVFPMNPFFIPLSHLIIILFRNLVKDNIN